ncbi:hypothetical protein D3C84_1114940 [compost metagenome]
MIGGLPHTGVGDEKGHVHVLSPRANASWAAAAAKVDAFVQARLACEPVSAGLSLDKSGCRHPFWARPFVAASRFGAQLRTAAGR